MLIPITIMQIINLNYLDNWDVVIRCVLSFLRNDEIEKVISKVRMKRLFLVHVVVAI